MTLNFLIELSIIDRISQNLQWKEMWKEEIYEFSHCDLNHNLSTIIFYRCIIKVLIIKIDL